MPRVILNLAAADEAITAYLENHSRVKNHHDFLLGIQKKIQDVYQLNKTLNQSLNIDLNSLSQQDFFKQIELAYYENLFVTAGAIQVIKSDIAKEKCDMAHEKNPAYADYFALLDHIKEACENTVSEIKNIDFLAMAKKNKETMDSVTSLGGRFIPFRQHYDILKGKLKDNNEIKPVGGFCAGYDTAYHKAVEKEGYFPYSFCVDKDTFKAQLAGEVEFKKAIWKRDINSKTNFLLFLDKLFLQIKPTKTYSLQLRYNNNDSIQHIISLRYIPQPQENELFDANFGIVTFSNRENFKKWLANLLCNIYGDHFNKNNKIKAQIALLERGTQPQHAQASIPFFIDSDVTENSKFELYFTLADALQKSLNDASFFERHSLEITAYVFSGAAIGLATGCVILTLATLGLIALNIFTAGMITVALVGIGILIGAIYSLYKANKEYEFCRTNDNSFSFSSCASGFFSKMPSISSTIFPKENHLSLTKKLS